MHITLISGSHRLHSQSARVAQFFAAELERDHQVQTSIIDLGKDPLPLWTEPNRWSLEFKKVWSEYSSILTNTQGLVVISPEWHGMATPAIKNFFLYPNAGEISHKPTLLVSVSSSIGGAYPISDLRANSYKNSFLCYLPEHLILRNIDSIFHEEAAKNDEKFDVYLRQRSTYSLKILLAYAKALAEVRSLGIIDRKTYPTGM